ncbi:hypothetical protein D3C87_1646360 [compost metagenome]
MNRSPLAKASSSICRLVARIFWARSTPLRSDHLVSQSAFIFSISSRMLAAVGCVMVSDGSASNARNNRRSFCRVLALNCSR